MVSLLFWFSLSVVAPLQSDTPAEEIKSVIREQMKAFNEEDYRAAYRFASRGVKEQFSLTRFEAMVRTGYPQIAKSRAAAFGEITLMEGGARAFATVHVTGADHVTVKAEYRMVLEEGGWKIDGVLLLEEIRPIDTPKAKPSGTPILTFSSR